VPVERGGGVGTIKGVVEGAVGVAEGAGVVVGADDPNESWEDFSSEFRVRYRKKMLDSNLRRCEAGTVPPAH
jgi:hypothetical protein